MGFCVKRNIIYALVLGLCLASLIQAKMLFGSSQALEALMQALSSVGIVWLMRGSWFVKLWSSLLTLLISYLILSSSSSFFSALQAANYFWPFLLGISLAIAYRFIQDRKHL